MLNKKSIFFALLNVENNRRQLERLVTYKVPFTSEFVATLATDEGTRVTKKMLKESNLDREELYNIALERAEKEASISYEKSIYKLNTKYAVDVLEDLSRHTTKLVRIFGGKSGAATLLSEKVLKRIERKVGEFAIIPDSTDSFTICLSNDKQMLNASLRDLNEQDEEEKLSDYCFSFKEGKLAQLQ